MKPYKKHTATPTQSALGEDGDRIAKFLARAGVCSRRDAEKMIADGRVSVDGAILTTPAIKVTAQNIVMVDGKVIGQAAATRLWRFNKPAGLVTTHKDPEGRKTVFDAAREFGLPRVVSVGRLDINTEGLLLLTNDGELARRMELPATGWVRRYRVRLFGKVTQADFDRWKNGVTIDGVAYGPVEATIERAKGAYSWALVAIREGKNREVKRLMEHLGLKVARLIRIAYGPFQLGHLSEGSIEEIPGKVVKDQMGIGKTKTETKPHPKLLPKGERPAKDA